MTIEPRFASDVDAQVKSKIGGILNDPYNRSVIDGCIDNYSREIKSIAIRSTGDDSVAKTMGAQQYPNRVEIMINSNFLLNRMRLKRADCTVMFFTNLGSGPIDLLEASVAAWFKAPN